MTLVSGPGLAGLNGPYLAESTPELIIRTFVKDLLKDAHRATLAVNGGDTLSNAVPKVTFILLNLAPYPAISRMYPIQLSTGRQTPINPPLVLTTTSTSLPLLGLAGIRATSLGFGLDVLNKLVLGLILGLLVVDTLIITTLAKLVDTCVVDAVSPSLVQINEEDDIVTKSRQAMKDGHLDGKGEQVINESVEELVHHGLGRHVGNALQAVVDVQRRHHHQETVGVDGSYKCCDDVRVPRLVRLIVQRVDAVGDQERNTSNVHVLEGNLVVLLSLLLSLSQLLLVLEGDSVREEGSRCARTDSNIDNRSNLPEFNNYAHNLTSQDHPASVLRVVKEVQEDDGLHENIGQDGAN